MGEHHNIIKLYTAHVDTQFMYLFMEFATGGDLFSYIKKHGILEEDTIRFFMKQMVQALHYCHENNVIHKDIKLENYLVAEDHTIRLTDFGLSHKLGTVPEFGGSPLWMPPEMFAMRPYDKQVDVWGLGVCLYIMVSGTFPFMANKYEDLEERVLFSEVPFPGGITGDLLNLLRGMLQKDPSHRLTIAQVQQHQWF